MAREVAETATLSGCHKEAAQKLLDAAHEYWAWRNKHGMHGAVCWIEDDSGRLLVFTRGEYARQIQEAIRSEDGYLSGPAWGQ